MKILGVGEAAPAGIRWGDIVDADDATDCVGAALKAAEEDCGVLIRSIHLATLGGPSDYGSGRRAGNNIGCLERLNLQVCDVAFPAVAGGMALLDAEDKQRGVLMIDLGAGKTGYVLYKDGEVEQYGYGCHHAGSAHVTHEISMGLRMSWERAETIKIETGDAMAGSALIDAETPWAVAERDGRYSDAEMMHVVIYLRWREILENVKARLAENGARLDQLGAGIHLTGGGSRQRGIVELASEVFGVPAFRATAKGFDGQESVVQDPRYSSVLGLLKLGEWESEYKTQWNGPPTPGRRYFGLFPAR